MLFEKTGKEKERHELEQKQDELYKQIGKLKKNRHLFWSALQLPIRQFFDNKKKDHEIPLKKELRIILRKDLAPQWQHGEDDQRGVK